jgi:mannose/fructose/N-acetylgalactosamine-specific phosphotransferase system component IID
MTHIPLWIALRIAARLLLLQARWDPARMQGIGLAYALEPWLAVCWAQEPAALRAARRRHLEFFNTHPIAAWLLTGIICQYEAAAAAAQGAEREAVIEKIIRLKTRRGSSLAGLYDSFFWGGLRPASALAGLLTAQAIYWMDARHSLAPAVAAALIVYNIPALAARWLGLTRGFSLGEKAIADMTRLPIQSWIQTLRRAAAGGAIAAFALGVFVLGGDERTTAALTFTAGIVFSWRGVPPLTQLGYFSLAGMAVSVAGFLGLP